MKLQKPYNFPIEYASYMSIHKILAGRPIDIEDVRSIIIKNSNSNPEYTRKWLREFDLSMESGIFTTVLDDLLKEVDHR